MADVVLVHSNFGGALSAFVNLDPPPGLGYLGAILEQHGIAVRIVDPVPEGLSKADVVDEITRLNPKVVGLTCLTSYRHDTFQLADLIRRRLRDVLVVAGGAHVSFLDGITLLRIPAIDAIVRGEGEHTFLEYVTAVMNGRGYENIAGLTYRREGEIRRNPDRTLIHDLDSLPFPAYHLFKKFGEYPPMIEVPAELRDLVHGPVLSSRGCPYSCTFCSSSRYWHRRFRPRTPRNIVDELEYEHDRFGVRYVRFYDDNFTVDRRRVLAICDEMLRRDLKITWRCESRIEGTDKEMLERMAAAGCHEIEYGVETGSDDVMRRIGKNADLEKVPDVIRQCKAYGIQAKGFFIVGLPGETFEDFRKTIELSKLFDYCGLAPLLVFPGSQLYEEMKAKGTIADDVWFETNLAGEAAIMGDVPVSTEAFSAAELARLKAIFYEEHPSYRQRHSLFSKVMKEDVLRLLVDPRRMARRVRSVVGSYRNYREARKRLGF